jgi:hypothetical protein
MIPTHMPNVLNMTLYMKQGLMYIMMTLDRHIPMNHANHV